MASNKQQWVNHRDKTWCYQPFTWSDGQMLMTYHPLQPYDLTFSAISIETQTFSCKEMQLNMSQHSRLRRPISKIRMILLMEAKIWMTSLIIMFAQHPIYAFRTPFPKWALMSSAKSQPFCRNHSGHTMGSANETLLQCKQPMRDTVTM